MLSTLFKIPLQKSANPTICSNTHVPTAGHLHAFQRSRALQHFNNGPDFKGYRVAAFLSAEKFYQLSKGILNFVVLKYENLCVNFFSQIKSIDTLDTWEDMSELGIHLINMPVELKFAKMIFFSIAMKCLSPILVIVSTLTTQDPCNCI
jgi:hypothetical protein